MPRRTALVAAALGGVLAGTACGAGPARADSASHPGSIATTIGGVPGQVTVGGSFSPTFTIRSTSAYRIEVLDFYFTLNNANVPDASQSTGIEVRWKDPASGAWRMSSEVHSGGIWALSEPARTVWIAPHASLSIRLYITMNGAAPRGIDVLSTTGICAYSLYSTSGVNVAGMLGYNHARTQFYFGAPSNGPASVSTSAQAPPTVTGPSSLASGPASSQPSSTLAAPGGAADTDGPPTDTDVPSAPRESTTTAVAAAPTGPSPVDAATRPAAGFTTYAAPLAALVLLGVAAFAGGVVLTRRGRGNR